MSITLAIPTVPSLLISLVTADEVIAIVSLRPQHITVSASILSQLSGLPPSPLLANIADTSADALENVPDYLAQNGTALRQALNVDVEVSRKVTDALKIFGEQEHRTKEMVLQMMA
jgi:transaldolase